MESLTFVVTIILAFFMVKYTASKLMETATIKALSQTLAVSADFGNREVKLAVLEGTADQSRRMTILTADKTLMSPKALNELIEEQF